MGVVVLFLFHYQGDSPQSLPFPVVDRPCLVLVRHCRKKKYSIGQGRVVFGFGFWGLFWGFVWFGLLWFPLSLTFPFDPGV